MRPLLIIVAALVALVSLTQLASADWTDRAEELEKELYNEVVKENSTEQERQVASDFAECSAANILAKMDLYTCKDIGKVSDSITQCIKKNPSLNEETIIIMMTCLQASIDRANL